MLRVGKISGNFGFYDNQGNKINSDQTATEGQGALFDGAVDADSSQRTPTQEQQQNNPLEDIFSKIEEAGYKFNFTVNDNGDGVIADWEGNVLTISPSKPNNFTKNNSEVKVENQKGTPLFTVYYKGDKIIGYYIKDDKGDEDIGNDDIYYLTYATPVNKPNTDSGSQKDSGSSSGVGSQSGTNGAQQNAKNETYVKQFKSFKDKTGYEFKINDKGEITDAKGNVLKDKGWSVKPGVLSQKGVVYCSLYDTSEFMFTAYCDDNKIYGYYIQSYIEDDQGKKVYFRAFLVYEDPITETVYKEKKDTQSQTDSSGDPTSADEPMEDAEGYDPSEEDKQATDKFMETYGKPTQVPQATVEPTQVPQATVEPTQVPPAEKEQNGVVTTDVEPTNADSAEKEQNGVVTTDVEPTQVPLAEIEQNGVTQTEGEPTDTDSSEKEQDDKPAYDKETVRTAFKAEFNHRETRSGKLQFILDMAKDESMCGTVQFGSMDLYDIVKSLYGEGKRYKIAELTNVLNAYLKLTNKTDLSGFGGTLSNNNGNYKEDTVSTFLNIINDVLQYGIHMTAEEKEEAKANIKEEAETNGKNLTEEEAEALLKAEEEPLLKADKEALMKMVAKFDPIGICFSSGNPQESIKNLLVASCSHIDTGLYNEMFGSRTLDGIPVSEFISNLMNGDYNDVPESVMSSYIAKLIQEEYENVYDTFTHLTGFLGLDGRKWNAEKNDDLNAKKGLTMLYMYLAGENSENIKYFMEHGIPSNNPNFDTLSQLGVSYADIAKSTLIGENEYQISDGYTIKINGNHVECYTPEGTRDLNKEIQINVINNDNIPLEDKVSYVEKLAEDFAGKLGYDSTQFYNIFQSMYDSNCSASNLVQMTRAYQTLCNVSGAEFSSQLGKYLHDQTKFGNGYTQLDVFVCEMINIIQKEAEEISAKNADERDTGTLLELDSLISVTDMLYDYCITFTNSDSGEPVYSNSPRGAQMLGMLFDKAYLYFGTDRNTITSQGRETNKIAENIRELGDNVIFVCANDEDEFDTEERRAAILNHCGMFPSANPESRPSFFDNMFNTMGSYSYFFVDVDDENYDVKGNLHLLYRLILNEECEDMQEFYKQFYN